MKKYILTSIILLLSAVVNTTWAQSVAKIGTTEYATLQEAFDAGAGQTITLLTDVTIPAEIEISNGSSYTLDMNSHDITTSNCSAFKVAHGTLNITGNGTISGTPSNYKLIYLMGTTASSYSDRNYSNLTIGENVTVTCNNGYAVMVSANANHAYGVNVTVDGTVQGLYGGLYVNGSIQDANGYVPKFVVNSTATVKNLSTDFSAKDGYYAIYAAGYANWTINGGNIYGGIELKSGELTVSGGTFTGLGDEAHTPNGNATSTSGYALSVVNNSNYAGYPAVEITGGTFVGPVNIVDDDTNATNNTADINIKGGTFSESVSSDFIDPNSNLTQSGTQYVVARNLVAEAYNSNNVSMGQFTNVDEAVTAAGEGGTVKLIHDIEGNVGISGDYTTTLDLNGHTITNYGGSGITLYASYPGGKTFTIIDSDPDKKGAITITKKYTGDGCISDSSGRIVVIEGGTYTSDDKALYISSADGWTINGGTFNGNIFVKSNLTINDGTFTGTVNAAQGNMEYVNFTTVPSNITITGGNFSGNPNLSTATTNNTIAVSGGTFTSAVPQEFCATGYVPTTADGGMFTVQLGNYVAKIETTPYATLVEAITAATSGQTIELLKNIDLGTSYYVIINKAVTIDGNNYTITGSGTSATNTDATIVLQGSGDITLTNLKVTNPSNNGVGIKGTSYSGTLTINNCVITAEKRGINVGSIANGFSMIITGSTIQSNVDYPTTTYATGVDSRGISFSNDVQSTDETNITITGTTIQGFRYDIYVDETKQNLNLTMTGGAIYGNVAICDNGESNTFTLSGVAIHGLGSTAYLLNLDEGSTVDLISGTTYSGGALILSTNNDYAEVTNNTITLDGATKTSLSNVIVTPLTTVSSGDKYQIALASASTGVAKIGETEYATLAAAVAAATDGQTITLLADISLTDRLFVNAGATPAYDSTSKRYATTTENKSFTLDLNGHNITSSSNIALAGGSLNITNNGTADATHGVISTTAGGLAPIEVRGTGDLTSKRTLTVGTGVTLTGAEYGLNVFGSNDANKNIIDVNVNGTVNGMLYVLGNLTNTDNDININIAGTVDASAATGSELVHTGVALSGNAKVTVADGAVIKGESGIEARAGQLTVNGGTITGTATAYSYTANGNGTTTKGAAVAVAQHTTTKPINVQLNGGTLVGTELIAVTDVNNNGLEGVSVTAKASFVENTETQLPDDYLWKSNGDGTSSPALAVARIGTTKYETLEAAFAAVQNGQTITMLQDVTLTNPLELTLEGKTVTFDLGGKTLTGRTNLKSGNLTIQNGTVAGGAQQALNVYGSATPGTENYSVLTIASDATVTADVWGVCLFGPTYNSKPGYGAVINIAGTVTTTGNGSEGAVFVSGNLGNNIAGDMNNVINVTGTITSSTDAAIALNGNATVNIQNGANITGNTAIAIKRGTLNVRGGTILSKGADNVPPSGNLNGTEMSGAGISMTDTYNQYGSMAVNISGGTIRSEHSVALYKEDVTYTNDATYSVSGGTFSSAVPDDFCAQNYQPKNNLDGTFGVQPITAININDASITVIVEPATYTGSAITPVVTVSGGSDLIAGTDYNISFDASEYINAKTYNNAITITGIGNYTGERKADFVISPRNINDASYSGNRLTFIEAGYTTAEIAENIILTYGNTPLTKGATGDYTITVTDGTYKNPATYPGVIKLTAVEGEGKNFVGSRTIDLVIGGGINITDCNVFATTEYNGEEQIPEAGVTVIVYNGTTEIDVANYDIIYTTTENYTNVGSHSIKIVGKNVYYGEKTVNYTITPKNIASCNINNSTAFTGAIIDLADVVFVKDGTTVLTDDDYTLTISNGYTYQNPQTYANAITITGKGNYKGSVTKDFVITSTSAINLASAAVVLSKQTYTGGNLVPTKETTTVTVNGTPLTEGTDYTFSFIPEGDNYYMDAKTYSNAIIIKAMEGSTKYYGTAVGNYIIEPRDLSDADITVTTTNLSYLNTEQSVTVQVKYDNNVIDDANYTYTPNKVTEAGKYIVTIIALENSNLVGSTTAEQWVFKSLDDGDYTNDFTIEAIPTQTYTGNEIEPTIVVKDKDRVMQLDDANGGDYTLTFENNIVPGNTATVKINGTGAYSGTITKTFTIVEEYFAKNGITYHHAHEGEEVSVGQIDDENKNVLATTLSGTITVPEKITQYNTEFTVTGIEKMALGGPAITAIVLPKSIADIANNAFKGADNMRYVDVTAMKNYVPETLTREFDGPFGGLPKQTLVYLPGTTFTGENYVYKPGDDDQYYCEKYKIYDDLSGSQTGFAGDDYRWEYEIPYTFTAYAVENTRMLAADKHYTTCLPYSIAIPKGVKAYTLSASSDKLMGFEEVRGTLNAFTPYVLIPTTGGQLLSTTNVSVPATTTINDLSKVGEPTDATLGGGHKMVGTLRYMDGSSAVGKYIMQYNDGKSTWMRIEASPGYENGQNRACILPMRAYIATEDPSPARSFTATFTDIDGIIRTETFTLDDEDTVIYDLQGRRVKNVEHGHPYIINGKKVIAK